MNSLFNDAANENIWYSTGLLLILDFSDFLTVLLHQFLHYSFCYLYLLLQINTSINQVPGPGHLIPVPMIPDGIFYSNIKASEDRTSLF
jgi:hypothetical protein